PSYIPKVVEDAIYICAVLSIPYLWVDKYCIDQHNPQRKAAEINAMGQIYRQAQITLI
ncbi:heterokaryon incompatibility, partial [Massarina eburnea CBS 473.64]